MLEGRSNRAEICPLLYIMWQRVLGWLLSTRGRECSAAVAHPKNRRWPTPAAFLSRTSPSLARQLFLSQRTRMERETSSLAHCFFCHLWLFRAAKRIARAPLGTTRNPLADDCVRASNEHVDEPAALCACVCACTLTHSHSLALCFGRISQRVRQRGNFVKSTHSSAPCLGTKFALLSEDTKDSVRSLPRAWSIWVLLASCASIKPA